MKRVITLLCAALLFGCGTNVVPPKASLPKAPDKVESPIPRAREVAEGINAIQKETNKADVSVALQEKSILQQRVALDDAVAQTERLREKVAAEKAITEIELANVLTALQKVKVENLLLSNENTNLRNIGKNVELLLSRAQSNVLDLQAKVFALEAVEKDFRDKWMFAEATVKERNGSIEELQKQNLKLTKESASAKVYKHWIIGLVSVFLIWTVAKNVLMIYFPTTRFRI